MSIESAKKFIEKMSEDKQFAEAFGAADEEELERMFAQNEFDFTLSEFYSLLPEEERATLEGLGEEQLDAVSGGWKKPQPYYILKNRKNRLDGKDNWKRPCPSIA